MASSSRRRPLVAGNWKMHKTVAEAEGLVRELRPLVGALDLVEVAVAPPFTALQSVARALEGTGIALAGQNCHWEVQGAFTGEVSAAMLRDVGCRYVIIGHSERRQYFGETDETVNRRAKAVFAGGMVPIVCVGETLQEREESKTLEVVGRQLQAGLDGLTVEQAGTLVLAYEPVWAIGTGKTATPDEAQEVHAFIRRFIGECFGRSVAERVRIQYGGSVKPENAVDLLGRPDIDGALVGGASLKAADFAAIAKAGVAKS